MEERISIFRSKDMYSFPNINLSRNNLIKNSCTNSHGQYFHWLEANLFFFSWIKWKYLWCEISLKPFNANDCNAFRQKGLKSFLYSILTFTRGWSEASQKLSNSKAYHTKYRLYSLSKIITQLCTFSSKYALILLDKLQTWKAWLFCKIKWFKKVRGWRRKE